jgi:inhibitor of KinA sporulation pathway (predicted exonuclease)
MDFGSGCKTSMRIANDYYLIVDLEATCSDDGAVPRDEMEIIEIGAVMQSARTFENESEFQSFVRPVRHRELTKFCTELTGIVQADVADAPGFAEAIATLKEWMRAFGDVHFCSWGNYDRKQFIQDCEFHRVAYPFLPAHINLKAEFAKAMGLRKAVGIAQAVRRLGMEFEGSHHRGLDDARNIARIVRRVCIGS